MKARTQKRTGPRYLRVAEDALEDTFTLQNLRARQPRLANGCLDWNWRGPNDDPEWTWFFNRHAWFPDLWKSWLKTGNPHFRDQVFRTLEDWLRQTKPPGRFTFSGPWRPLEVARRLTGSWLPLWEAWQDDHTLGESLRKAIAQSLQAHGEHLRKRHALGGNHLITEMMALFELSLISDPSDWQDYSLKQLEKTYRQQVYPDGVHKELSSHYQKVITLNYSRLAELLADKKHPRAADWHERIQKLWTYLSVITTPDGFNPLNNDSDLEPLGKLIQQKAPPPVPLKQVSSTHFPWAGQTVFHGQQKPHYGFFDAGPRGTDHDHADRLHFSISVGTSAFLVDNGRFTYKPGPWRAYFAGPRAHNCVFLGGRAIDQGPRQVHPTPFEKRAFESAGKSQLTAWGTGPFCSPSAKRLGQWRRTIQYTVDERWEVEDEVIQFNCETVETLWHFHPNCEIPKNPKPTQGFCVRHGQETLFVKVELKGNDDFDCVVVTGQTAPEPQGWYSEHFNQRQPAPCLKFIQKVSGPVTNVWTFTPRTSQADTG